MVRSILESGTIINAQELADVYIWMVHFMKVNGLMIYLMGGVDNSFSMAMFM